MFLNVLGIVKLFLVFLSVQVMYIIFVLMYELKITLIIFL